MYAQLFLEIIVIFMNVIIFCSKYWFSFQSTLEPEKSKFSFEEDDLDMEDLLGPYLAPQEGLYGHQQHKDREYKPVGFFFYWESSVTSISVACALMKSKWPLNFNDMH